MELWKSVHNSPRYLIFCNSFSIGFSHTEWGCLAPILVIWQRIVEIDKCQWLWISRDLWFFCLCDSTIDGANELKDGQIKESNTLGKQQTQINEYIFWYKYDQARSSTHPKFNPVGVWTHDLQMKTAHLMSLRHPSYF